MYTKFLLTILTVLSFMSVAYCKFAEPQTIEPFAGLMAGGNMTAMKQSTISDGQQCSDTWTYGNESNPYNGDMEIMPSSLKSPQEGQAGYQQVMGAVAKLPNAENFGAGGLENPGVISEGYTGPDNFYTVPGQFQSEIAPRFMNTDFGANITYNFPDQDHLAVDPTNPLSLANDIENFEQAPHENYENVATKFAQVHEPVPLPRSMDGPSRENLSFGGDGGDNAPAPQKGAQQFHVHDNLMMVLSKNRLHGSGDYIRGDLAIMPDSSQCGWFKSQYANPVQSLNTGALYAMGGQSATVAAIQGIQTAQADTQTAAGGPIPPQNIKSTNVGKTVMNSLAKVGVSVSGGVGRA